MIVSIILAGALSAVPTPRAPAPVALSAIVARRRVPSFARQMKLSCSVCHVGFPELTWFGRMFKLNGYTLSGLEKIADQLDSTSRQTLALTPIPALSVSVLISSTSVAKALPGTPATRSEYPQQLSVFWGGQVSTDVGALVQLTYSDVTGKTGIDLSDVRFAKHRRVFDRDLLFGATLHNVPTAQDPWNTLPAWSFPFVSAVLAPRPGATPLLDGPLDAQVLGLGAYGLFDQLIYAELTGYTSAPQGPRALVDSTAANTLGRVAPYWRVALQHSLHGAYVMVGTFGLAADVYPRGVTGQPNHYNDYGLDAQIERAVHGAQVVVRASWIREDQSLLNSFTQVPASAARLANSISSLRVNATAAVSQGAFTLGTFSTTGTPDRLQYPSGAVEGSAAGRPDSRGQMAELVMNPWLNSRVGVQYVRYDAFNGRATSYDVPTGGRNAADNNTLYLFCWIAF